MEIIIPPSRNHGDVCSVLSAYRPPHANSTSGIATVYPTSKARPYNCQPPGGFLCGAVSRANCAFVEFDFSSPSCTLRVYRKNGASANVRYEYWKKKKKNGAPTTFLKEY